MTEDAGRLWARGVLAGFGIGVLLCAAWIALGTLAFANAYSGRVLPGARIAGIEVGGMTRQEALQAVRATVAPELDRTVRLVYLDRTWETTPGQLGATSDAEAAVDGALAASEAAGRRALFRTRWLGHGLGFRQGITVVRDQQNEGARALVDRIAAELDQPARDASLDYSSGRVEFTRDQVGRAVAVDATSADLVAALSDGREVVEVKTLEFPPAVTMAAFDQLLLLRQGEKRLYLYQDGVETRSWLVATGSGGYPTPRGEFFVQLKRYLPTWVNPDPEGWGKDMPAQIGPGPNNPLGLRALNWSGGGAIRFHRTANLASLGQNASKGCVRLSNTDVVQLYDLVDVGAKIISLA